MCADCKPEKKSQILHIRPYPEQGENGLPKRKPGLYQDSEPFGQLGIGLWGSHRLGSSLITGSPTQKLFVSSNCLPKVRRWGPAGWLSR